MNSHGMDTSINTKQTHGMNRSTQTHMQARKEQNMPNTKCANLGNNWHTRTQRERENQAQHIRRQLTARDKQSHKKNKHKTTRHKTGRTSQRERAAITAAAASLCSQLKRLSLHCVHQQLHEMERYGQEVTVNRTDTNSSPMAFLPGLLHGREVHRSFPFFLSPFTLSFFLFLELPQSNELQFHHDHLLSKGHAPPRPFSST